MISKKYFNISLLILFCLNNLCFQWHVLLRRGAVLYVPKALRFDRFVAGQVPTHWSAERLGVPKDIIRQVDRVTLFTLASTAEALISAGMTDPYEFCKIFFLFISFQLTKIFCL